MITIVMTTWFKDSNRLEIAKKTLESWEKNLKYSGQIFLHQADDGSIEDWKLRSFYPTTYSRQERHGVGASLNTGFIEAFKRSPYVLYMVDDWQLMQEFDLDPWVELLEKRTDVGCVRLGPPHPNNSGIIMPFTENWQGWGMLLDRRGYAVSHRPSLYHKRFIDDYDWWKEKVSAIDCEKDMADRFNTSRGCGIVLALPHPWYTEGESMSEVTP